MQDYAIYLDLDGVMADYAEGMRRLGYHVDPSLGRQLNKSGSGHPLKREMYERIKGTEFYRDLPLQPGAVDLYRMCAAADPIILTAAPKFAADEKTYFLDPHWAGAAYHKRTWVETILLPAVALPDGAPAGGQSLRIPIPDERFVCTTSKRKWEFMHRKHSWHQVLIDDRIDNVEAWAANGGVGIMHVDAETSITALGDYDRFGAEKFRRFGDLGGLLFDPR